MKKSMSRLNRNLVNRLFVLTLKETLLLIDKNTNDSSRGYIGIYHHNFGKFLARCTITPSGITRGAILQTFEWSKIEDWWISDYNGKYFLFRWFT